MKKLATCVERLYGEGFIIYLRIWVLFEVIDFLYYKKYKLTHGAYRER